MNKFEKELMNRLELNKNNLKLLDLSHRFFIESFLVKYSYNFSSLGRPIIQYPQDVFAMSEIIWKVKPDLIIETGIAHGGSLIHNASILALLDLCEAIECGSSISPGTSKRKVLGLDINIKPDNRLAIESHPMSSRIKMIEGSSIDPDIVQEVKDIAKEAKKILVCLVCQKKFF